MSKKKPAAAKQESPVVAEIAGLVDAFCREHLNDEYAALCRRLTEKLARKRPSPLLSGQPNSWAAGIVRTIGWVNFLDDKEHKPHMKLTAIDKAFGISESTGQTKMKLIRNTLKIHAMSPDWCLPSKLGENPLVWMIQINGLPLDARYLPRDIQVQAFQLGLIPYVPEG